MPAVSNSSPLILYAVIGRLDILRETYGEIIIPPAVWRETVETAGGRPGAREILASSWSRRQALSNRDVATEPLIKLDPGEAEAIAVALGIQPRIPIVLDDRVARQAAETLGLAVTGSVGVLVRAKSLGMIELVGPILDELRGAGLYLSEYAASKALESANER